MNNTCGRVRWAAVLLAVCLLCAPAAGADYFAPIEHPEVHFDEMGSGTYDYADLQALLDAFSAAAQAGEGAEAARLLQQLIDEIDVVETQYALADIHYYLEVDSAERQQRQEQMRLILQEAWDDVLTAIATALDGPCEPQLAEVLGDYAADFYSYEPMTDSMRQLSQRENDLTQSYYSITAEELSDRDYAEAVGPLFLELRDLRMEMAEAYGFDSYAELASLYYYGREYGARDIDRFCRNVRDDLVDAFYTAYSLYDRSTEQLLEGIPELPQEQLVDLLGQYIGDISPELAQAQQYLARNGLYNIGHSGSKASLGFTTSLPQYHTAFIYDSPTDSTTQNMSTLIHEFGHFCADHFGTEPALLRLTDYDLFEVHSQGLEVLFFAFYEQLYGEAAEAVIQMQLEDFLFYIVYYAYLSELELDIYGNPGWTLDDINRRSAELLEQYRITFSALPLEEDGDWLHSDHLVTSPMYSISYAVSGMAALDIWQQSLTDRAGAIDTYLSLVASGTSRPFLDTLEQLGMQDVFAGQSTRSIAAAVYDYFGTDAPAPFWDEDMLLLCALVAALLLLILWLRCKRRRRKARALADQQARVTFEFDPDYARVE